MIMPFQVMMAPSYLILERLGLLDTHLAILVPGIFSTFPVYIMERFFESIPDSLLEAAYIDGAGEWVIFFRITVPNLFSAFFTITVLSLINSFKVFREAYLVAGDYPDESIYMLQHLFNNWYRNLDVDKMAAGAVLSGAVLLALVSLFWKRWEGK